MSIEMNTDVLPKTPEPGVKWRRNVAELEMTGEPATIVSADGNETFAIPTGYSVVLERWTVESDHPLTAGQVYAYVQAGKFGKEATLAYFTPYEIVARVGGKILYRASKVRPTKGQSAKSTADNALDAKIAAAVAEALASQK